MSSTIWLREIGTQTKLGPAMQIKAAQSNGIKTPPSGTGLF